MKIETACNHSEQQSNTILWKILRQPWNIMKGKHSAINLRIERITNSI